MKRLLRPLTFFRADAPGMAGAAALMAGSVALNLLKPWPVALLIDSVLGSKALPAWLSAVAGPSKPGAVLALALAVLAIHLLQGAAGFVQNVITIQIGLRALTRV